METCSIQQVCNQSLHVRRKHATASHVSVVYRLTGLNKAYDEDYIDDMEHSVGRHVLEMLIQQEKFNVCVCIIRYYGGEHLGQRHFEIVKDLVNQALIKLEKGVTHKSTLPLRVLLDPKKRGKNHPK